MGVEGEKETVQACHILEVLLRNRITAITNNPPPSCLGLFFKRIHLCPCFNSNHIHLVLIPLFLLKKVPQVQSLFFPREEPSPDTLEVDTESLFKSMEEVSKPFLVVFDRIAIGVEAAVDLARDFKQKVLADNTTGDGLQNDAMFEMFSQPPLEIHSKATAQEHLSEPQVYQTRLQQYPMCRSLGMNTLSKAYACPRNLPRRTRDSQLTVT